jgi:hypothetical protein
VDIASSSRQLMSAGRSGPALVFIAVVLLVGCGGGNDYGAPEVEGVGEVRAGSTAQFATCKDWREGTRDQRYATLRDIRGQLTPQSSQTAKSDLSDETAYRIFQKTCASGISDSLRLYKLYARAQAYAPLRGEADQ